MISKIFSRICIILMALLISGCSTFSFVFERLDWFALWQLDNMFDLTEEQEAQAQPDLVAIQQWMREEGFPQTISRLEALLELWETDKPEAAYLYLMSAMTELNVLYLNTMKESVIRFSLGLTEKNAHQYREYTNEKQEDWFESTQSLEARIEHETDRFEDWFGRLNDDQIKLIENWASLTENELQVRRDNLTSWREAYLEAAINRDAPTIKAWLEDLSIFWTPEYIALKQHNNQQRQDLVFELFPTLSPKQKRHAREHVENWVEKLRDVL